MSDVMQAQYPQQHQLSKFAESRLKLSTSCVECHRRKQKCDRKQPCGHCSRRYPPPACIYRTLRDTTSPKDAPEVQSRLRILQAQEHGTPRGQVSHFKSKEREDDGRNDRLSRINYDVQEDFIHYESGLEQPSLSIDTLDKFSAEDYQQLLNTMVSQISSVVLGGSVVSEVAFLERSRGGETWSPQMLPGTLSKNDVSGQVVWLLKQRIHQHHALPSPNHFGVSAVDPLHYLGITPTAQSAELLQAFLKLITKYVVSLDGNTTPNYYNDYWVPWSMKSPLLAHLGIFTAAIYQAEAQKTPSGKCTIVLRYKVQAIKILNEMLSSKSTATCNEAIAGVTYLLTNEWYWNNPDVVQRHMRGLKEIIRLRGGIDELGMRGFLKTLVLLTDYNVACSYDREPAFPHDIVARPSHPVEMSIPFVITQHDYSSSTEKLQIGKETATILDEMRFLILTLVKQLDRGFSEQEKTKLVSLSAWIRACITSLPDGSAADAPLARDYLYKSCRIAALIYCKAIVQRTSLSRICTLQELNNLWANMWHIKLSRWKQIPGIFLFIILSALPSAQDTPHGRFLKTMFKTTSAFIGIGLGQWELVDAALMAFVKLQRWLRTGEAGVVEASNPEPLDFMHIWSGED